MGRIPSRSGIASDGSHGTKEQSEIHRALVDPVLTDELVELCVATEILVRDSVRDLDAMNKEEDAEEGQDELGTFLVLFLHFNFLPPPESSPNHYPKYRPDTHAPFNSTQNSILDPSYPYTSAILYILSALSFIFILSLVPDIF
jgi:hypothetical protein